MGAKVNRITTLTIMLQTEPKPGKTASASQPRDAFLIAYRWMLLARTLDDKMASLYRAGKMHGGVFLGRGQEALSVAIGISLCKGDIFAPLIRDLAGRLAFGQPLLDPVRTYMGSALGPMRGRDGNVHHGRPREGIYAMISHLGAMISVVNGALIAHRFKGQTGSVGATCIGEGGTSTGAFHEALNQAGIEKLPLVLVVADNQYAYSTPVRRQFACADLLSRATGYGVAGHSVDGTDLSACLHVVGHAVEQARAGRGPQLVVAHLLRLCGHGEHDDASYIDGALKQSPLGRDCLKVAEEIMLRQAWATRPELETWKRESLREVEDAVVKVQQEPMPDPYKLDWCALAAKHLSEVRFG
jgi:pyruvate dehydrogenase E1 component alpha subunit/2-oxoisovalerate dehydrogenase E1 component alpha subunit